MERKSRIKTLKLADYANTGWVLGGLIYRNLATLCELQTVYSLEDALDMLEIIRVNDHNLEQAVQQGKQSK